MCSKNKSVDYYLIIQTMTVNMHKILKQQKKRIAAYIQTHLIVQKSSTSLLRDNIYSILILKFCKTL